MKNYSDADVRTAMAVYLVTDDALCLHHSLMDVVQMAVQAGATCVQLREKNISTGEFVRKAKAMKQMMAQLAPHVPLLINDRVDVALAAQVDGVHVGQSDMNPIDVRRLMSNGILGWSVQTVAHVQAAHALIAQGVRVDYLGVGPIYFTATKSDIDAPMGLEGMAEIRAQTNLPLVAIGGIQIDNACEVVQAGADGVAVVSAICAAEQPQQAVQALLDQVHQVRQAENLKRNHHE